MEVVCNFFPLFTTNGLCPQISVNIESANLHTDFFGGSQAVPCGQKNGRTERHDKKKQFSGGV
jgi:hypothetical protein